MKEQMIAESICSLSRRSHSSNFEGLREFASLFQVFRFVKSVMASIPLEIQIMVVRKAAKQLPFKILAWLSLLNKTWFGIANDIMDDIIAKRKVLDVHRGNVSMFKKLSG